MCLVIPGKIKEVKGRTAIVDYGNGVFNEANLMIDVRIGDYVIVSGKMIVNKVDKKEAEELLNIIHA